jgi:cytochrome oxidase assembly protein ShyY1
MTYRFLRTPRWLALHVLFVLVLVGMVNAGLWQLRRLEARQALNARLDERTVLPVAPVTEVLGPGVAVTDVEWRPVAARGTYRAADEVLVRGRSFNGTAGAWVLTPLVLDGGGAVLVNRGFVPGSGTVTMPPGAEAPGGTVSVEGYLVAGQTRGRFGPTDPSDGRLETLARADIARIQQQLDYPLLPALVQLRAAVPPPAAQPTLLPVPERSEGPHLGYALQWFTFTAIAAAGYPLLIRRRARPKSPPLAPTPAVPPDGAVRAPDEAGATRW